MYQESSKQFSPFIIFLILLSMSNSYSRVDTLWTKTFGGNGGEVGYSIQQTIDEGYIIAGFTTLFGVGTSDVWLIKTNVSGDTLWTKTFGGSGFERGNSVQQTIDEGYIIIGETSSFGAGEIDAWLIKTNVSGDTLWTKTFGGNDYDWGISVQQTIDEGYIITGYTDSFSAGGHDVWLIKTDASGDTLWTKTFGGSEDDLGYSVQQNKDGGYILTGLTFSFGAGGGDIWLIKTNANGDSIWTKTFGGNFIEMERSGLDCGNSVQQTKDEGYIITGYTDSFGAGSSDFWLIKTNASGDTLWTKTFGGHSDDYGYSVQQTIDEGYIITGHTSSFGAGNSDVWLIKTNADGDTLWTKTFGGSGDDYGYSVQQTIDEGYIITGVTTSFGAGSWDVWLIKTTPDVSTINKNQITIPLEYDLSQNFPNPFNPTTTIEFEIPEPTYVSLKVFNIMGQEVATLVSNKLNQGSHTYKFDGSGLASGIYYYQLVACEFHQVKKMILLK